MFVALVACAPVAQWIERRFPVPKVGGSTPLGGTIHPLSDWVSRSLKGVFAFGGGCGADQPGQGRLPLHQNGFSVQRQAAGEAQAVPVACVMAD